MTNPISKLSKLSIDVGQDFSHFDEEDKESFEIENKAEFIESFCLNGKVVLYPMYEHSEVEIGFACGPQTEDDALSDFATIDGTLKKLVKDTPYQNAFDIGVAENDHAILVDELPQGKSASDAYEFIKQKLMEYSNVVLNNGE